MDLNDFHKITELSVTAKDGCIIDPDDQNELLQWMTRMYEKHGYHQTVLCTAVNLTAFVNTVLGSQVSTI